MCTATHPGPRPGQHCSRVGCSWAGGGRGPLRPCGPAPDASLCPGPRQRRRKAQARGRVLHASRWHLLLQQVRCQEEHVMLLQRVRWGGTVPREHGEADVNAGEPRGQSLESFVSDKSVTDEVGWENWQGWPCLGTLGTAKDKPGQRCCPQGPPGSQGPLAASSGPPPQRPLCCPPGPPAHVWPMTTLTHAPQRSLSLRPSPLLCHSCRP